MPVLNKKVIVCDLDGTLAPSKSKISSDMAEVLRMLLERYFIAVISGGAFPQFENQFLSELHANSHLLANLYIFPTMGTTCYVYDKVGKLWKELYKEELTEDERKEIKKALKETIEELKLDLSGNYGDIVEDRGTQVTFSGKGQDAPIEVKKVWDPDQIIRRAMIEVLSQKIPQFDIRIGGSTSIDINKQGMDKAYAIEKIKKILNVKDEEMIFIGDALYSGGNDSPVKKTDIDYIQEEGPSATLELLSQYL
jgi:phosphomannomutase